MAAETKIAQIIADSLAPSDYRLTTMVVRMPRYLLAQANTHRMFSRNAASNRAIPTAKLINAVREDYVKPSRWPQNGKGMQPAGEIDLVDRVEAEAIWQEAANFMVFQAERLNKVGVHKEVTNRLLEPFQWVNWLVTGDQRAYANFFHLRCDHAAQHDMMLIAEAMREVYFDCLPQPLKSDQWHLPFDSPELESLSIHERCRVCVARCARISYNTHTGVRDPEEDRRLAGDLAHNGHWSPFEHVAKACLEPVESGNFKGWFQFRKLYPEEAKLTLE